MAQGLLERAHDPNKQEPAQDKGTSGYAPHHWAAQKGHLEVLQLLLLHGANKNLKDKHGNTAQALAEKKGLKEIVALLEATADPPPFVQKDKSKGHSSMTVGAH